jgi:hypothetical protein
MSLLLRSPAKLNQAQDAQVNIKKQDDQKSLNPISTIIESYNEVSMLGHKHIYDIAQ